MSNSTMAAPRPAAQKATKEERRRNKQRQFIAMTSIAFIVLFIFSMCITAVVASVGAVDPSIGEIEQNKNAPNDGKLSIVHTSTYNKTKNESAVTESPETTEIIEEMGKPTGEKQTETTEPSSEEVIYSSEKIKSYSEDDLYYLAAAVCREAGGSSEEIQLLVANVVINRVNSSMYPNTIYEVLTQYKQYGTMWKNGVSFPNWANDKVKDQCYSVAKRILEGERYCPENVLFQAEFEQGSGIFKQFGDDYYFCYYG